MSAALAGLAVLVTRPSPEGEALCARLRAQGALAVHQPALAIREAPPSAALDAALAAAAEADWLIFVSRNAVRYGLAELERRQHVVSETARIVAVGPATARCLAEAGLEVFHQPSGGYTSEDLLGAMQGGSLERASVVIFRGNGGRELLAEALSSRGAAVLYAEVYRREAPALDLEGFAAWAARPDRVVVLTSRDGLDMLLGLLPADSRQALLRATAVAGGARLAHAARAAGFGRVLDAADPTDAAVLEALTRLAGAHRRRGK